MYFKHLQALSKYVLNEGTICILLASNWKTVRNLNNAKDMQFFFSLLCDIFMTSAMSPCFLPHNSLSTRAPVLSHGPLP